MGSAAVSARAEGGLRFRDAAGLGIDETDQDGAIGKFMDSPGELLRELLL